VKYLNEIKFNFDVVSVDGSNAYMVAAYGGHLEIMNLLEANGNWKLDSF
jgi:hypothetical protein